MTATGTGKSTGALGLNPDAPLTHDLSNVLELRKIRRQVKQTASLVSTLGRVYEQPGSNWMADIRNRTIFWRGDSIFGSGQQAVSRDELLFLVTHEASHLNYTGGWTLSGDIDEARFHRFLNGVEDIRVERLTESELGGFGRLRNKLNPKALELHRKQAHGYHMLDQVWLNWFAQEYGAAPMGTPEAQEFAKKTWPKVTRMCNAKSTQDLAEMIEPIYRELIKDDPPSPNGDGDQKQEGAGSGGSGGSGGNSSPDADSLPQDMDSKGNDEPVDNPERSPLPADEGGSANGPNDQTLSDMLSEMLKDALSDQARRALEQMIQREHMGQAMGDQAAKLLSGQNAGDSSPPRNREGNAMWENAKASMRPQINALERRLTATLRHNALDDWEPGLRRGQLDPGVAYRSLAGHMNIFRDRHAIGELDYTFGITVDMSSSQSCRSKPLLESTVLVCEALSRAGLGLFVIPWNTELQFTKPLGRPLREYTDILGATIGKPRGGTYEAPALVLSAEQFSHVTHGIRVLITLTDGDTRGVPQSEQVIRELEDNGVTTIGIGIAYEAPRHYQRKYSVQQAEELATLLPKLIAENVRRG